MYGHKLAVAVKCDGKVLRENGTTVMLPFQSEYSIQIKNMHSTRASVSIIIDGKDVLGGRTIVVNPGSTSEVERFVDDLDAGRKFKFIKKTEAIEAHRGNRLEDGLIEIRYQFEAPRPPVNPYDGLIAKGSHSVYRSLGNYDLSASVTASASASASVNSHSTSFNADPGITVEGSESLQKFTSVSLGVMESARHTLVIQMMGTAQGELVTTPITVKTKKTCESCGSQFNSNYEYCPKDGTYLRVK